MNSKILVAVTLVALVSGVSSWVVEYPPRPTQTRTDSAADALKALTQNKKIMESVKDQAEFMRMMMMKMYFHFGLGDIVLFKGLVMDSSCTLWLTSVVLFLAAILLELIDYSRGYLSCRCAAAAAAAGDQRKSSQIQLVSGVGAHQQSDKNNQRWSCCSGSNAQTLAGHVDGVADSTPNPVFFPVRTDHSLVVRLLQSSLHSIRTALSLCLMLVAMTFNVCLIFPLLLGSGVGFYIFYRPALDSKSVMCH